MVEAARDCLQAAHAFGDDFGPDTVTGENGDQGVHACSRS
jgi:hypothetical protein